jgi:hypothetical protein
MPSSRLVVGSILAAAFVVVGCNDQSIIPVTAPSASSSMTPSKGPALQRSSARSLPKRTALSVPSSVISPSKVFGDVGRVINPDDYVCSDESPVVDFLFAELDNTIATELPLFLELYTRSADLIPTYDALYFGSASTPQSFGYNGAFTKVMVKTERDVKRFWDIPSADVQVLAMHGTVLLDTARTARTYRLLGVPDATAFAWAAAIRAALLQSTTMHGGNYAYWTFNAYSFSTPGHNPSDRIVMGDGILEAYAAIGYGDVAPQAIFAHEFAHQIQFENNYFDDLDPSLSDAEHTRYSELMADAMSAYFLTHARGAALNQKRVEQFLQVFYQIGDCAFTDPGHHGTPNQRLAAARFGFSIADQAQKQGHILTSAEFHALFVAQYPTLIAPDAH